MVILRGLSPPTRGIRCLNGLDLLQEGSIPAYAGDPFLIAPARARHEVYPRLRGGSSNMSIKAAEDYGLSPPTRGIRIHLRAAVLSLRSIPAYAGDPTPATLARYEDAVYPRLRGGSQRAPASRAYAIGLSPPTRGIPASSCIGISGAGSIPAYAGDPRAQRIPPAE